MRFVSYAQNFEDVMLWRALGHVANGSYIDVGANDPVVDSVSLAFYEHGWRGIHVDAAIACAESLRSARPDEVVLHAAMDAQPGTLQFYSFQENGREIGISCADEEIARKHIAAGYTATRYEVPCMTLDALLDSANKDEIHWLKIDVEGFEGRVLQGWQTSKRNPWIIVIESTRPTSSEPAYREWEHLLLAKEYQFAYFDGLNRYYVHADHLDLKKFFSYPPCVFDDFELRSHSFTFPLLHRIDDLSQQVDQLTKQRDQLTKQRDDLTQQVNQFSRQREDMQHEVGRLRRMIYGAKLTQHLYRAWMVAVRAPAYIREREIIKKTES